MFNTAGKFYQEHFRTDPPADSVATQDQQQSGRADFTEQDAAWRNSLKEGDEVQCAFELGQDFW